MTSLKLSRFHSAGNARGSMTTCPKVLKELIITNTIGKNMATHISQRTMARSILTFLSFFIPHPPLSVSSEGQRLWS